MKPIYYLMLILLIGIFFLAVLLSGGRISFFLNYISLLVVVISTVLLLRSSFSFSDFGTYFAAAFEKNDADEKTLRKGIIFFQAMQGYLLLSAVMGTLIGIITLLAELENPARIGSGMALALMTILYAFFLYMIIALPFKSSLQKRLSE